MYYIVAENYVALGQNGDALAALDKVRVARGVSDAYESTADAATELMKEYYREFISEGQLVYYLKHCRVSSSIEPSFDVTYEDLVYPYPVDEVNYGRVQEL